MAATVAPTPLSAPFFTRTSTAADLDGAVTRARTPRTASNVSSTAERQSTPQLYQPDMNREVTALSNKLINAINYQTNLDDSLVAARLELEASRDRIRQLEAVNGEHEARLADGTWVRRTEMQMEQETLQDALEEERRQRAVVEREKKGIEQELENLTTALFEEANQMVAAARHERDAAERKSEQLKSQLKDAEVLLVSQQEQLAELKTVLQQMTAEREEMETNTNHSTAPTSPLLGNQDQLGKLFDALHLCPHTPGSDDIPPSYPTSFSHLLQPVVRTDLAAYQDFTALLRMSRTSPTRNRASTGAYSGLSKVGLGGFGGSSPSSATELSPASQGSSPAIGSNGTQTSSSPGGGPATPAPSGSSNTATTTTTRDAVPLRETRFYKRVLAEDIEPTLRLETAPGLSWLARRTVIASMSDGNLVVEPLPATPSLRVVTCALCGERRRGDEYTRTHQFKTNDTENAQRYPLCKYCTGRVRATCDFLGFLRMVKDGHWRAEGDDAEKAAWEESVKLRECMFWARIGGGVVPAFVQTKASPRNSSALERRENRTRKSVSEGGGGGGGAAAAAGTEEVDAAARVVENNNSSSSNDDRAVVDEDLFHSNEKRVSIGTTVICVDEKPSPSSSPPVPATGEGETSEETRTKADVNDTKSSSLDEVLSHQPASPPAPQGFSTARGEQRLSITIPGSFE